MPFGCTPNGILNYLNFYVRLSGSNLLAYLVTYLATIWLELLLPSRNFCHHITKNIHQSFMLEIGEFTSVHEHTVLLTGLVL